MIELRTDMPHIYIAKQTHRHHTAPFARKTLPPPPDVLSSTVEWDTTRTCLEVKKKYALFPVLNLIIMNISWTLSIRFAKAKSISIPKNLPRPQAEKVFRGENILLTWGTARPNKWLDLTAGIVLQIVLKESSERLTDKVLELLLRENSNLFFKMDKFELNWHVFIDTSYFQCKNYVFLATSHSIKPKIQKNSNNLKNGIFFRGKSEHG